MFWEKTYRTVILLLTVRPSQQLSLQRVKRSQDQNFNLSLATSNTPPEITFLGLITGVRDRFLKLVSTCWAIEQKLNDLTWPFALLLCVRGQDYPPKYVKGQGNKKKWYNYVTGVLIMIWNRYASLQENLVGNVRHYRHLDNYRQYQTAV